MVPAAGRGRPSSQALGCRTIVLGSQPDGRYDHPPEPTEANLKEFAAVVPAIGAAVGFAQDPDADRLAIVDETGRYIGEELTLALAAARRLQQSKGPIVLNLSTSRVTEDLARRAGCPVVRTPVGEINVVEKMIAENALLGGEGNGGVIDPRVGYVRDSFVAMAMVLDLMAATGETLSVLVSELPRHIMIKDQYPLALGRQQGSAGSEPGEPGCGIGSRRRARTRVPTARDGLRLDWEDRWVHMRASNTEPIVRVIAEAAEATVARELADRIGRWVHEPRGGPAMSRTEWPTFERAPAVAFVDVDGTLLAQTTTFLFARILYRRGWIRRSFFLRAVYHGLQHRFGRLDYGRLIGIGMTYIASIPVVELERIAYENFVEFVRPRLYEGVVEHLYSSEATGDRDRAGLVVAGTGDPAAEHLFELHGHVDDTGGDRTRPTRAAGRRSTLLRRRQTLLGRGVGTRPRREHGRHRRLRRQLERSGIAGKSRPGSGRSSTWPSVAARSSPELGHRPPQTAPTR